MTATFYLFDVCHGQSAALQLANGQWCVFDVGCRSDFSPVVWLMTKGSYRKIDDPIIAQLMACISGNNVLKATISHFHGDHLADWENLISLKPQFMKTVNYDLEYLKDSQGSNTSQSWQKVLSYAQDMYSNYQSLGYADYGSVQIREMSLPVEVARSIGGDTNARVNNASIITRIDVYGNSILLCGDMQKEAWEAIINDHGDYGRTWRPFLSNIDILVAPHHGHRSGYSASLMKITKPSVVLVSAVSRDPNVDTRYSQHPVKGVKIGAKHFNYISTRRSGHIKIRINAPLNLSGKGKRIWTFGDEAL